jgi:Core binding factor beta subunit
MDELFECYREGTARRRRDKVVEYDDNENCQNKGLLFWSVILLQVHLKSQFIMNGVCVVWRGWLDLFRLDGTARLEYDHDRAAVRINHVTILVLYGRRHPVLTNSSSVFHFSP